jgi:hypothetical protein
MQLPETPLSPRAALSPLHVKPGLAAAPALRGTSIAAARKHLSIDVALEAGRTGEHTCNPPCSAGQTKQTAVTNMPGMPCIIIIIIIKLHLASQVPCAKATI